MNSASSHRVAALSLLLALAACDSSGPTGGPGDPLPSRDELVAEFSVPPPGRATIRETGNRPTSYNGSATHFTSVIVGSESTTARFFLDIDGPNSFISARIDDIRGDTLEAGDSFGTYLAYGGRGDGGGGGGALYITGVEGDRVAGVFVADLSGNGLFPSKWRIVGAFNAELSPGR